jgi:hypothetical protein
MKKLIFITILFFIMNKSFTTYLGKWDENYYQLQRSLNKRRKKLRFIKSVGSRIAFKNLIENYKERNLSQEEKQLYARYYCRNKPEFY